MLFKLHIRDAATIARLRRRSIHLHSSRYLENEAVSILPEPELDACSEFSGKDREMVLSMVGSASVAIR